MIFVPMSNFIAFFDHKITTIYRVMISPKKSPFDTAIITEHAITSDMNIDIFYGRVDDSVRKVLISSVNDGFYSYYLETIVGKPPCSEANVSRAVWNSLTVPYRLHHEWVKFGEIYSCTQTLVEHISRTCSAGGECQYEKDLRN